jgi:Second Messenger Oligonucleotide or Dinucleotide Synthetase domain
MAGGGGRGGPFVNRTPEKLGQLVRREESKEFEAELSGFLGELLSSFNSRDVPLVTERLQELKRCLEGAVGDSLDQLFGGSVAKHTYVDGLSDIDSLLIINSTEFHGEPPKEVLQRMSKILSSALQSSADVSRGRMAVTVTYPDGMSIQLLPAVRIEKGLKVPSSRSARWSEIDPEAFRQALSKRNEECGGKLVPTIKLAKAVIGSLPEAQQLSGYHVESLAIAAFKAYSDQKTTSVMLPRFFERAKDLVLDPMRDSTGQSVHVDEYLGPPQSEARQKASHILGQITKRMRNATGAMSKDQWKEIFQIE